MIEVMANDSSKVFITSKLSLQPLVSVLKKMVGENKPAARLYKSLLNEVEGRPELLQSMNDQQLIRQNAELVETLLSTVFPPSTSTNQEMYAVTFPFAFETIYTSAEFRSVFQNDDDTIDLQDKRTTVDITKVSLSLAYNIILNKLYELNVPVTGSSVHAFSDSELGLRKFYELNINAQFVDVKFAGTGSLPQLPETDVVLTSDELTELFPLHDFVFEGIFVITVNDVTGEQVLDEIRNTLINMDGFSDSAVYDQLQALLKSLIGTENVAVGITPFFKKNDVYLYTETHFHNSILFRNNDVKKKRDEVSDMCRQMFQQREPRLFRHLQERRPSNPLVSYYIDEGAESILLCPLLCDNGELIGLLEIVSDDPVLLKEQHLKRLLPAIPLFTVALEKLNENLQMQVDKTIKEHFTAVQPAVEWKFTTAAFQFLQYSQHADRPKMPPISFENVFPLYGSIDIRNSSVERNNAIQLDLLEQLTLADDVLDKAAKVVEFPLLNEIRYRIKKYIDASSDTLLSDDEIQIYDFLQEQLTPLMDNLLVMKPELKKTLDKYRKALDEERKIIYHHRKEYEDSITRINEVLDRFIDQEQKSAQEIYPHYFERYFTDGVEFNIYVGQSISPQKPFDIMYVRNLKLWQLAFLAKAARITSQLEQRLPLTLQTTQLILAQAIPLSISFRRKERKFDVDGAYNIRYEIVKKRIDKVHLRDSDERLTQPGTVSIVYSQQKEMAEYMEYIEFLQSEGLFSEKIEHLELEDTQGISGLKAIRVDVNLTENNSTTREPFTRRETQTIPGE